MHLPAYNRKSSWALKLLLQIFRDSKEFASLNVESSSPSPPPKRVDSSISTPILSTPAAARRPLEERSSNDWSSSTLFKRSRLSGGSWTYSPYDPFTDEGDRAKKRQRRSWVDVGNWKFSAHTPSPEKDGDPFAVDADLIDSPEMEKTSPQKEQEQGAYETPVSRNEGLPQRDMFLDEPDPVDVEASQALQTQATQELVDMVAGDTEPETEPSDDQDEESESSSLPEDIDRPSQLGSEEDVAAASPRAGELFDVEAVSDAASRFSDYESGPDELEYDEVYRDDESVSEASEVDEHSSEVLEYERNFQEEDAIDAENMEGGSQADDHGSQLQPIVVSDSEEDGGGSQENESEEEDEEQVRSPHHEAEVEETQPAGDIHRSQAPVDKALSVATVLGGLDGLMPPPSVPTLRIPSPIAPIPDEPDSAGGRSLHRPKTPELQPVASPTLPLPSPFPGANENTARSFFSRPLAPEPPKEAAADEEGKLESPEVENKVESMSPRLTIPHTKDRKKRRSSSVSRKNEIGPFGEHFRARHPFGLDGAFQSREEVVVDEPSLAELEKVDDFPRKLEDAVAASDAQMPPAAETLDADQGASEQHVSEIEVTRPEDTDPPWEPDDWFEPPSGDLDVIPVMPEDVQYSDGSPLEDLKSSEINNKANLDAVPRQDARQYAEASPRKLLELAEVKHENALDVPLRQDALPPPSTWESNIIDLGRGSEESEEEEEATIVPPTFTQVSIELGSASATQENPLGNDEEQKVPNANSTTKTRKLVIKDSEEGSLSSDKSISTVLGAPEEVIRPEDIVEASGKGDDEDNVLYPTLPERSVQQDFTQTVVQDGAQRSAPDELPEKEQSLVEEGFSQQEEMSESVSYPLLPTNQLSPPSQLEPISPPAQLQQGLTPFSEPSPSQTESDQTTPRALGHLPAKARLAPRETQHKEAESALPPTPSLTQQPLLRDSMEALRQVPPALQSAVSKKQKPKRKKSRPSAVPDIISQWFVPSRASLQASATGSDDEEASDVEADEPEGQPVNGLAQKFQQQSTGSDAAVIEEAKAKLLAATQDTTGASQPQSSRPTTADSERNGANAAPLGLRTPLSYYTPLHSARLRPLLNSSYSQHSSTQGGLVDIIAVITSPPKIPQRADKGPRDWNTMLSIADPNSWASKDAEDSEWPRGEVQVQCFMGGKTGKDLLPAADAGDVILLREFGVMSRKGKVGLINKSRGSGWCVWRFGSSSSDSKKPIWAQKAVMNGRGTGKSPDGEPTEEMRGAPVEIGEEERREATRLRHWWEGIPESEMTELGNTSQETASQPKL